VNMKSAGTQDDTIFQDDEKPGSEPGPNQGGNLLQKRRADDHMELWYSYLDKKPNLISGETVIREGIYNVKALIAYLTTLLVHKPPVFVEVTLNGQVISNDENFNKLEELSKENFLQIKYRYITYIPSATIISHKFFEQRSIAFYSDITLQEKFQPCISHIQDTDYKIDDIRSGMVQIFYSGISRDSESAVHVVAAAFLLTSFGQQEGKDLKVLYNKRIVTEEDKHEAIPDSVIFSVAKKKFLLICEDKKYDIEQAMLQNFDQLRSFSLSEEGKNFRYVYGLVTNLKDWRFCCYVKPPPGRDVSADNFIVSTQFQTFFDETQLPTKGFVELLAQIIRGFLTKDIDAIVDKYATLNFLELF